MAAITSFDSTKESLIGILKSIGEGKTQLPDFQRGWIWDDDHIRSLLASVSLSYPIGAVMMLETGNVETRFKPRLIEGVTVRENPEPQRLILDGQQRLTSLYQALMLGRPVTTRDARGREIKRWYYLDIAKALSENGDREEAIVALPENRCLRNFRGEVTADYSTIESECTAELLPLRYIADAAELMTWQLKYFQTGDPTKMEWRIKRWTTLLEDVLQPLQRYDVPLIFLRKGTPKEAICQVFEKVNTGGVSLTVFELLTATYAADDFNLRDDWQAREKQIHKRKVLGMVSNTDFLQAVTLLSTWSRRADGTGGAVYCRRKDILRLQLDEYKRWASPVVEGFEQAAKFLHSQKVFDPRDLPYNTQLVPLAAILTALGDLAHTDGVRRKLSQWYWCGVFGELYGSAVESRFALDLTQVLDWIDGGPEPATVRDASFVPNRLLTLRTRNSAAYKGLSAILMREGCQDFRSGSSIDETLYFDERVDIHHLFPRDYCKKAGIEAARRESVVNKTPLSAKTHRTIGWNRPSIYLNALQRRDKLSPARVDQILFTHLIDPTLFRSDDFDAFFEARKSALLQRVAIAMGKPIREESEQLDLSVLSSEELHLDDEYEDDSPQLIEEDEGNETKQPRKWDEPSFMAEMATRGEKELTSSRQILEWGKKKGCRIWWGKGITNDGSYYLMLDYGGIGHPICGVRTGSSQARVEFPFRDMRLQPPFDNRAKREEFRQKLNVVEGINLNSDSLDRYPRILLSEITSEEALESFLATLDWVITEIRGFDVSIAGTGR